MKPAQQPLPEEAFYSRDFLLKHGQSILNFYNPRVIDNTGGYFQNFRDNGDHFDDKFRQLVSSTRIVVNYALASLVYDNNEYLSMAKHGLDYVEQVHWQQDKQRYAWTLNDHQANDMTQQAYGYAFVLLAYAAAKKSGLINSNDKLLTVYQLLEERFWQAEFGLYADEISADGQLSDYRGQNANMHLCEAMIAAYEATSDTLFLQRAQTIAENIAIRQADLTDGLVWEHYTTEFTPDWEYNKDDPKNLYRPWGFQPGHQTEWTKLLLMLNRHQPQSWLVERAKSLFDRAYQTAWDNEHGGLIYGFDPQGKCCDNDKYFWVQAESFAAAAMLYQVTKDKKYLEQYNALWQYSWQHMVDHQHGAWFRILKHNNTKYSDQKSAAGAKCDYHTLGACFEVLRVLGDDTLNRKL
ncbi:AGE family epimerase/isomerase [Thalassotalea sp. PP2-459]|uniref:AGE family epimerase/isomerase n=1 Tax=Thalassotalea sp. PP2-459 TaxID=1742724 RepID=UPI000943A4AC|nr:AGE family epimerase/isomerase [Thalassotalea sp. PP2-459]OKY26557.1 N-acylglucosamine 2-epimerase [Thalassotalea sp. PP2-459]